MLLPSSAIACVERIQNAAAKSELATFTQALSPAL